MVGKAGGKKERLLKWVSLDLGALRPISKWAFSGFRTWVRAVSSTC